MDAAASGKGPLPGGDPDSGTSQVSSLFPSPLSTLELFLHLYGCAFLSACSFPWSARTVVHFSLFSCVPSCPVGFCELSSSVLFSCVRAAVLCMEFLFSHVSLCVCTFFSPVPLAAIPALLIFSRVLSTFHPFFHSEQQDPSGRPGTSPLHHPHVQWESRGHRQGCPEECQGLCRCGTDGKHGLLCVFKPNG